MLSDDTKDAILANTDVWESLDSDTRWQYITNLTDTERTTWGLEADTVAIAMFYSEYRGNYCYEWDKEQLESVLSQDAENASKCHCFDDTDDPEMTDPDCPAYHNNW